MFKGFVVLLFLFHLKEVFSAVTKSHENETVTESPNDSDSSEVVPCEMKRSSKDELIFKLYTGKNISDAEVKEFSYKHTLKFKNFHPKLPVIMIINADTDKQYLETIQKTFLHTMGFKNHNLIFAQWPAEENLKKAVKTGKKIAKAIRDLRKDGAHNKMTLIGHGYGVVVAGKAGNVIYGKKINKIVGLDPPAKIKKVKSDNMLNKKSAKLVEVVHTSIGAGGLEDAIGHRDFYPNGGQTPQPFCGKHNAACNRNIAYKIYMAAYRSKDDYFESTLCVSWHKYLDGVCDDNVSVNLYNEKSVKELKQGKYYLEVDEDYNLDN